MIDYYGLGWYLVVDDKTKNIDIEWKPLEGSSPEPPSGTSKEIARFIVTKMSEHANLKTIFDDLMNMPDNALEEKFNDKINDLSDDE